MELIFKKNYTYNAVHIKGLTSYLYEKFINHQSGKSSQEIFTPIELTLDMLKSVDTLDNKSILVIANLETYILFKGLKIDEIGHKNVNWKNLYFLTDNTSLKGKDNVLYCDFNKLDKLNIDMKFDVVIGNPPYSNGLHNSFACKCFELLKDKNSIMTIIHPSNYVFTKSKKINGNEKQLINTVSKYDTTIKLVDGNKIFKDNAYFFAPLAITTIKNKLNDDIKIINSHIDDSEMVIRSLKDEAFVHGSLLVKSIINKIRDKNHKSFLDISTKNIKNTTYFVSIPGIYGHPIKNGKPNPDFSCLISKTNQNNPNEVIKTHINQLPNGRGICCNTYEEAINIFHFMKTKFCRFIFSTEKIGQNIWSGTMLKAIPYLDFSKEWNDEKVFSYFNFSNEEIKLIISYIEDFYDTDLNVAKSLIKK